MGQTVTTRYSMPDWAKAKEGSRPDPEIREMAKRLMAKFDRRLAERRGR